MDGPRAATPADAQAVWDSMQTPTTRRVADSLMQAGFAKLSHKTIHRWKEQGWAHKRTGTRQPALVEAKANIDTAVPVLTGDATTRLEDVVPSAKEIAADAQGSPVPSAGGEAAPSDVASSGGAQPPLVVQDASDLDDLADNALMKLAAREAYKTTILLLRRVQARMDLVGDKPRELGSLQAALAGSLTAANQAIEQVIKLETRTLEPALPKPAEGGGLNAAMLAFKQARGEA
jgi:hypothetical protein